MRLPASPLSTLTSAVFLAVLLGSPLALARPFTGVPEAPWAARARGLPAALALLPAGGVEFPSIPVEPAPKTNHSDSPRVDPARPNASRAAALMADAPVSPGAWMAYGTFSLVPLGGVYGASRLGGERLWVTAAETAAGSLAGSLPGGLLFLQPAEAGGRWTELDVASFGVGLALTPPIAALGTWGLGELAFHGSQDRGSAYLGALGGAAVGMLLGVAVHGLLEEVVGNRSKLMWFRKAIALGFIGSGATVGYQWAGGGPRDPR
ncbi:hypothetical protein [Archangium sp.]|uniref:hypothetical protein n=1 Tax=Archangium sp. TaxID=1872627 RepID=UPI00389A9B39